MQGRRIVFAYLVIPDRPDLHITIANNRDATDHEFRTMTEDLSRLIRVHLPISLSIGNFALRGATNTIPTYSVDVDDKMVEELLQRFYRTHYKVEPGKRWFPKLEMHITVDTPEKLSHVENVMLGGPSRGKFVIDDARVETHIEDASQNEQEEDEVWRCPSCRKINSMTARQCYTPGCTQWRPLKRHSPDPYQAPPIPSAPPMPKMRHPDWRCTVCGDPKQFGSREICRQCGKGRRPT